MNTTHPIINSKATDFGKKHRWGHSYGMPTACDQMFLPSDNPYGIVERPTTASDNLTFCRVIIPMELVPHLRFMENILPNETQIYSRLPHSVRNVSLGRRYATPQPLHSVRNATNYQPKN